MNLLSIKYLFCFGVLCAVLCGCHSAQSDELAARKIWNSKTSAPEQKVIEAKKLIPKDAMAKDVERILGPGGHFERWHGVKGSKYSEDHVSGTFDETSLIYPVTTNTFICITFDKIDARSGLEFLRFKDVSVVLILPLKSQSHPHDEYN